jgi:ribosomal protein L34E
MSLGSAGVSLASSGIAGLRTKENKRNWLRACGREGRKAGSAREDIAWKRCAEGGNSQTVVVTGRSRDAKNHSDAAEKPVRAGRRYGGQCLSIGCLDTIVRP